MSKIEDAQKKVIKKIVKDKESLAMLRTNEFMRDEIRFLTRQIDSLENKISYNRMGLIEKYKTNEFSSFWFWNPIEKALLIHKKPDRKFLEDYFKKVYKEVKS